MPGWRGVGKTLEETPLAGVACTWLKDGRLGRRFSPGEFHGKMDYTPAKYSDRVFPEWFPAGANNFDTPKKSPPGSREGKERRDRNDSGNGLVMRFIKAASPDPARPLARPASILADRSRRGFPRQHQQSGGMA
ncbi:hypothetical protein GCM10007862_29060 [Dyella lipolytica]|nr:hypothetical protein GCM10007862_29060 [Dyella lipolytica]